MINSDLYYKWQKYCDSYGWTPQAAAARLGVFHQTYRDFLTGKKELPIEVKDLMIRIMQQRDILDATVLQTKLFKQLEAFVKHGLTDKIMITATAPTGQGKSISAQYLSRSFNAKYYYTLAELQREKKAASRNFVRALSRAYGINERSTNNESNLIDHLMSDNRSVLIIDESQRLITEDFGYFKIIQDIFDNVPNLSIILLGNYKFFDSMKRNVDHVMHGLSDEEQFLRRISSVHKLSSLTTQDVKLWCEFNNINLKDTSEYKHLAEFFRPRAGLADMEVIRKEIIKNVLGQGRKAKMEDFSYDDFVLIYKKLHTELKFKQEDADDYFNNAANLG